MIYEAPVIEDLGSIADHTFMPPATKPGNADYFPLEWHPGQGSAPS